MELAFDSRELRAICESEATATNAYGQIVAEMLKHRLADLRAATSVRDLVAGRPRMLHGEDRQHMVVDLAIGHRLVFCANHPENPSLKLGMIDWSRVSRIKILRIETDNA